MHYESFEKGFMFVFIYYIIEKCRYVFLDERVEIQAILNLSKLVTSNCDYKQYF